MATTDLHAPVSPRRRKPLVRARARALAERELTALRASREDTADEGRERRALDAVRMVRDARTTAEFAWAVAFACDVADESEGVR